VAPQQRGTQIWESDGSAAGTRIREHVVAGGGQGSTPFHLTPFQGGLLFGAWEDGKPLLWRSDGTPAGTAHIANSFLSYRTFDVGAGLAWFVRVNTSNQHQLWRSNGTEAGTVRLTPDGIGPILGGAVAGNKLLFLVAHPDDTSRSTFWESDGTVAGTRSLSEFPADAQFPGSLLGVGSKLYFIANRGDSTGQEQLWITDGTTTTALTNFESYPFLDPPEMAVVGTTLFFRAQGELWKTDGTVAGTVQVPFSGFDPSRGVAFHGALYFMAELEDQKRALFRSDGTGAGTVQIKVVGDTSAELTVAGDRLFLVAGDREHGRELWTSDGTADGTRRVRDILPGEGSASPSSLVADGNRVFFAASDGQTGFEIWESDGTAAGTRRLQDLAPGPQSSNPKELAVSGGRLFFVADDGIHGEEPWVYPLNGGGCVPSAEVLCLGGRFQVEAAWRDFQGNQGAGQAVALTADTGTFWFFDAANVEVILKVLDGRSLNGHHWVFYGALSNVEYSLTVTDTQTGAARRYINPPGRLGSLADTEAFGPRGAKEPGVVTLGPESEMGEAIVSARTAAVTASCTPGPTRLCLQDGRFAVEARWKKSDGTSGAGQTVPLAGGDTGYFWFFDASNVEVVLKVLDGRPLNGKFWVFYGALSDVEYTLTVTDTETGAVKTYTNPKGRLASVADTGAF
jgi:ELWxxDGT repeat protein